MEIPKYVFFGIWLQALKPEFGLVVIYTRVMVINLSGKTRMIFSVQAKLLKESEKKIKILALFVIGLTPCKAE